MEEEIILREKERSLHISRVPKETKGLFIKIAEDYFEGDYGMLLKTLVDNYTEYQQMKILFFENIDMKLDNILDKLNNKPEENQKDIVLLSGKKISKGGK